MKTPNAGLRLETSSNLAQGGDALARAPDGRIVFLRGAAPNEVVEAEIVQDNKSFIRARVVRVIEASPERVEPRCKYFGVCGGCTLQHVSADAQLRSKNDGVMETLARIGGVDRARLSVDAPWSSIPYGYRSKVRFAIKGGAIGFREQDSRRVIDIDSCPILEPALGRALLALRASSALRGRSEVEVDVVAAAEVALVAVPSFAVGDFADVDGVTASRGIKDAITLEDEHGKLLLLPEVFAQANAGGNHAMVTEVAKRAAGATSILELYSGSGNFTRALSRIAPVHAVEFAGPAVELARRAASDRVTIEEGDVEVVLERLARAGQSFDCVVLDPPRAGTTARAIEAIACLHPRIVVYVSCDPATFARDIRTFGAHGIRLEHVRVFDLYPQTAHVELIGLLGGQTS